MITSKLSGQGRTTIPLPVRALRLAAATTSPPTASKGERVVPTRADAGMAGDPFAAFGNGHPRPTAAPMPRFEQNCSLYVLEPEPSRPI
jgi:hypothetical protein